MDKTLLQMSKKIEFKIQDRVGWITLNVPKQLNAIDLEMTRIMAQVLDDWRDNNRVCCVVIQGQGRAFCAGGNLKELYFAWEQGTVEAFKQQFFAEEYALNRRIFHFPKPYIAIWDGIVMGGGMGISVHGSHRIVTENAKCAMPETGIGYFPDVGACYFLQKCPGQLGLYLGLTGLSLTSSDILYTGLGTHFVSSHDIPDFLSGIETFGLNEALNKFNGGLNENAPLKKHQKEIDRFFQMDAVEYIFDRLEKSQSTFAQHTLAVLKSRSLLSLRETFSLFKRTKDLSFDQAIDEDLKLSKIMGGSPEFIEGIRAAVIDKDHKPRWSLNA